MTPARHSARFPDESEAYRAARNELLEAELDLRRRIEGVAAKRRSLPVGEVPEDFVFEEQSQSAGPRRHDRSACRNSSTPAKTA